MRHVVSSALVLFAVAFLGGCAGAKAPVAKAPAAPHMSIAMDDETSRALLGEAGDETVDDENVAVGTTTLTSATFIAAQPEPRAASRATGPAPEDVIGEDAPAPARTWGTAPTEQDGIPTNRE